MTRQVPDDTLDAVHHADQFHIVEHMLRFDGRDAACHTPRMTGVRIGIIGVGGMGSFHARTLASLSSATVVAVTDPHAPNAAAIRDAVGAEIVDDPMTLIGSGMIDALVIASPDDTHAELAIAAIDHDIPTLCEKPLATSVHDARRVVDAEAATGRRLVQLGFMREYDPAHVQVREALRSLGRIDHVRAVHRNANTSRRPLDRIVVQSMIHDVHSIRFLTGQEITSVHASGAGADAGSFRHVVAICRLSDGAHATVEFDDGGFAYDVGVEILTDTGDVLIGPPTSAVSGATETSTCTSAPTGSAWFADAYPTQDRAWVDSIRHGHADRADRVGRLPVSQVVVDAILESLATGRTIEIEPAASARTLTSAERRETYTTSPRDERQRRCRCAGGPTPRRRSSPSHSRRRVRRRTARPRRSRPARPGAAARRDRGRGSRGSRASCASRHAPGRDATPVAGQRRADGHVAEG